MDTETITYIVIIILGLLFLIGEKGYREHPEWFPNEKNHPGQLPKDIEK